jgi:CSLREA domain-containing protein
MKNLPKRLLCPILLAAFGILLAACIPPATLTVNSENDANDGACDATHCSLREAINKANTLSGTTAIKFNIPGAGVHTIRPETMLPVVLKPVYIDGATQPGFVSAPVIELDGSLAVDPTGAGNADGLVLAGGGSTVYFLVINRFGGNGIRIEAPGGNMIYSNYIGTDITGKLPMGNQRNGVLVNGDGNHIGGAAGDPGLGQGNVISDNGENGVLINSGGKNHVQGNRIGIDAYGTAALGNHQNGILTNADLTEIGGTTATFRNVISANGADGVRISGGWTDQVYGNYIGTDITGSVGLGNYENGINVIESEEIQIGGSETGARNVISGNQLLGIKIDESSTAVKVYGNYVGTDATGTAAIKNIKSGIRVSGTNHQIGGIGAGNRNTISGNGGAGIVVTSPATGIRIQNNYIGTDYTGTAELGNRMGIEIGMSAGPYDVTIGGDPFSEGNLISGNAEEGVLLYTGAKVYGNKIGTDISGAGPLGNHGNGILSKGDNNTIGATALFNTIAFNGKNGVAVITENGTATGNAISWNAIHDNGGLGIAIAQDSVLPNDLQDPDAGDNNKQNYPEMVSAVSDTVAIETTFTAKLDSTPNTQFTIEFFTNAACDPSGYGEGHRAVRAMTVTTDAAGKAEIVALFPSTTFDVANFVTATATDPAGNTSGFSNCIQVTEQSAATATPAAMTFEPIVYPLEIFYGNCEPAELQIAVDVFNSPKPIGYVLLFVRLMDPTSFEKTEWSPGLTMIPSGNNRFYYNLSAFDLPDYNKFPEAVLQYQFVVYDEGQNKIGMSEVFGNVALKRCGRAPGPAATPTPRGLK